MTRPTTRYLRIAVRGTPAPQGSKRFVGRAGNGRGIMVESSARVKPWREAVKAAAVEALGDRGPLDEPVIAVFTFTFPRPRSHYRTGRNAHLLRDGAPARPAGKPDLSKLVRSTEDALTDAGVWRDDALVVDVAARKYYAPTPGAVIEIWPASIVGPKQEGTQ